MVAEEISGHPGSLSSVTKDAHQIVLHESQHIAVSSCTNGSTVEKTEDGELHLGHRYSRLLLEDLSQVRQSVGQKRH